MRVLLVEDDELVRCVMAELLRNEGLEVHEAHDGDFAASFINTSRRLMCCSRTSTCLE